MTWTHRNRAYLPKTFTSSCQKNLSIDRVDDLQAPPLTEGLSSVDSCERRGQSSFLEDVATNRIPMLQWMASQSWTYGQQELDVKGSFLKTWGWEGNVDRDRGRVKGVIWGISCMKFSRIKTTFSKETLMRHLFAYVWHF